MEDKLILESFHSCDSVNVIRTSSIDHLWEDKSTVIFERVIIWSYEIDLSFSFTIVNGSVESCCTLRRGVRKYQTHRSVDWVLDNFLVLFFSAERGKTINFQNVRSEHLQTRIFSWFTMNKFHFELQNKK